MKHLIISLNFIHSEIILYKHYNYKHLELTAADNVIPVGRYIVADLRGSEWGYLCTHTFHRDP